MKTLTTWSIFVPSINGGQVLLDSTNSPKDSLRLVSRAMKIPGALIEREDFTTKRTVAFYNPSTNRSIF